MRHLIACCALLLTATAALAGFDQTIQRGQVRRLVIDVPAGEVTVRNGAADRITISGYARRNEEMVQDAKLVLRVAGDQATVARIGGSHFTNYSVRIEVPPGTAIAVNTRYGEVRLGGTFGDIDVSLRAGEVHLETPRASVRELNASALVGEVHTNLGDRTIDREGVFPGRTHWENAAGKSRVTVHTTAGEVHVTLVR
ncbi:MAG TPA: hypothetical protein VGR02_10305 [Thermoanaerobaculia bacterium]|jgi:hypothetical protein|nr:hypothetical protein [Thermoanaerobaculia bacterium]